MNKTKIINLVLILLVLIDATGDAFRFNGWQDIHHLMESLMIVGWFVIWAKTRFNLVYIVMYILGRFVLFDVTFNLIAGNAWWYVGESSLYGQFLTWFCGIVKQPISNLVTVLKAMALIWWIAWFWTNRTFRELK